MGTRGKPEQLWERHNNESSRAFQAFSGYLSLGPERSIDKAFRSISGTTAKRAPRRWFVWSERFKWTLRAKAWDENLVAVSNTEKEQAAQRDAQEWAERRRILRERQW